MGELTIAHPVSNLPLEILCIVFLFNTLTYAPFYDSDTPDSLFYKNRMKLVRDVARYSLQVCGQRYFSLLDFSSIWSRPVDTLVVPTSGQRSLKGGGSLILQTAIIARYRSPTRIFSRETQILFAPIQSVNLQRTLQRESTLLISALAPKMQL